jgi:flagellar hook-associated protein 2
VTSVAKSQTLSSPVYAASTSTVGSGTLTLKFGTVSGSSFTEDTSHSAVDITVPAGALSDVATAINASGAGVTAYVANGSNGAQLVLKGKDGAANGFVLEASENASDPGLSNLAWSPSGDLSRLTTTATDAVFKLDGVQRTSVQHHHRCRAGPDAQADRHQCRLAHDDRLFRPTSAISTAMSDLVDALNSVAGELKNDTDPNSGALNNDPGARSLQNTLTTLGSTVIMPNAAAGAQDAVRSRAGDPARRHVHAGFNRLSATLANYPRDPRPCSPTACMASTPRSTRSRATSPRQWTPVR